MPGGKVGKQKTMNDYYWCIRIGVEGFCVDPNWLFVKVVDPKGCNDWLD